MRGHKVLAALTQQKTSRATLVDHLLCHYFNVGQHNFPVLVHVRAEAMFRLTESDTEAGVWRRGVVLPDHVAAVRGEEVIYFVNLGEKVKGSGLRFVILECGCDHESIASASGSFLELDEFNDVRFPK